MDPLPTLEDLQARGPAVPGRELTDDEQAQVVKRPSPRRYGKKGEQWARERMKVLMGATLRKNEDTLSQYTDKDGVEQTFFKSAGVDYSGTMPLLINGVVTTVSFEMEVKTFQGSFSLSNISDVQRDHLNQARKDGKLALIALVEREDEKIKQGWIIPWRDRGQPAGLITKEAGVWDWGDIVKILEVAATQDARFQGKSLRQKDLHWIDLSLIEKAGGKWQPSPWMRKVRAANQPQLL